MDISTHATHKGGDNVGTATMTVKAGISTHATHKGGDGIYTEGYNIGAEIFQLTPPIRVATSGTQ